MSFFMIGIEQRFQRQAGTHKRQIPHQFPCVLRPTIDFAGSKQRERVRGITKKQEPPLLELWHDAMPVAMCAESYYFKGAISQQSGETLLQGVRLAEPRKIVGGRELIDNAHHFVRKRVQLRQAASPKRCIEPEPAFGGGSQRG